MSEGIKLTERQQNDGQSNLNFGLFLVIESIIYSVKSTEKLHTRTRILQKGISLKIICLYKEADEYFDYF